MVSRDCTFTKGVKSRPPKGGLYTSVALDGNNNTHLLQCTHSGNELEKY